MIKGLYLSVAGMLSKEKQLEFNANNLANINTIGYKKDKIFFRQLMESVDAVQTQQSNGQLAKGKNFTDFSSGTFHETGNPLDLAIAGEGFFVIQTQQGSIYTRNGNFTLSAEGRLVTQDGYSVMGTGGEIQIAGNEISVSETGDILVDGKKVDKLRVVQFDDPNALLKLGGTYFTDQDSSLAYDVESKDIQLRQGYLESSNVNGINEIVEMIELYKQFEFTQKMISTQDHTLRKLINEAGRTL